MKMVVRSLLMAVMFLAASIACASVYNLDQSSGWTKCTSCSTGDLSYGWFQQYVNPYSLDGKGMKFYLGGSTPYRNSLWYKGVGGTTATNLVYDLYFYITQPNYSEALEFDINQYVGGKAYIFGHQCSPKWSAQWDVWDPYHGSWVHTGISCPVFPAYKWNHVTIQVQRTSDQKLHYVSITFNGVTHYVNKYLTPTGSSWYGLSVDFQMDGDFAQHNYATWLDKIGLTYW